MSKNKISEELRQEIISNRDIAESFITQPTQSRPTEKPNTQAAQAQATPQTAAGTMKLSDFKKYAKETGQMELKTRRVCLLMQPSLYEAIKAQAQAEYISVNEYIHRLAEQAIANA